jgi:hypothetical protein
MLPKPALNNWINNAKQAFWYVYFLRPECDMQNFVA